MPGFDALPPTPDREPISPRNVRLGLFLFALYLAFYALFVALNALWPQALDAVPLGGVNLAVLYGFALIVAAFALALVYVGLCRRPGDAP